MPAIILNWHPHMASRARHDHGSTTPALAAVSRIRSCNSGFDCSRVAQLVAVLPCSSVALRHPGTRLCLKSPFCPITHDPADACLKTYVQERTSAGAAPAGRALGSGAASLGSPGGRDRLGTVPRGPRLSSQGATPGGLPQGVVKRLHRGGRVGCFTICDVPRFAT
jgi:hypothetical protein